MSQFFSVISWLSRSAFTPRIVQSFIVMFLSYHNAARQPSVMLHSLMLPFVVCQNGYLSLKVQRLTVTSLASLKADSPSAGPSKVQSVTVASFIA